MTDLTADLNVSLQRHGALSIHTHEYDTNRINTFLQEAYNINARIADLTRTLRSIRSRYLSNAAQPRRQHTLPNDESRPLTDREREVFDAQSKQLLRQLHVAIKGLKQAEEVRNQTADSVALSKRAKSGFGAIGRWAAGGAVTAKSPEEELEEAQRNTIAAFREAVVMFLQTRLEEASRVQTEMMEVRLSREVEKSKSALYKSRAAMSIPYAQDDETTNARFSPSSKSRRPKGGTRVLADEMSRQGDDDMPSELTQEQMQLFAAENSEMLKHYEDQLDQVRKAEQSVFEISELHSTLHANLQQQSEHVDKLVQDSYLTTANLGKGNKELKKASERRSTAQAVFYSTVAFCSFLVVWDLIF